MIVATSVFAEFSSEEAITICCPFTHVTASTKTIVVFPGLRDEVRKGINRRIKREGNEDEGIT